MSRGAVGIAGALLVACAGRVAADASLAAPRLRPGAVEIGAAGTFTDLEGETSTELDLRGGTFLGLPRGLLGFELGVGWAPVAELDRLTIQGALGWQHTLGADAVNAFAAVLGGWSEEWLGSFHEARYPLGFALGLRLLPANAVAARLDYRWRRFLDDPVSDFTEQQILFGISILLRNSPPSTSRPLD